MYSSIYAWVKKQNGNQRKNGKGWIKANQREEDGWSSKLMMGHKWMVGAQLCT